MLKRIFRFKPRNIACTVPGCEATFRSEAGVKRHVNAVHAPRSRSSQRAEEDNEGAPPSPIGDASMFYLSGREETPGPEEEAAGEQANSTTANERIVKSHPFITGARIRLVVLVPVIVDS